MSVMDEVAEAENTVLRCRVCIFLRDLPEAERQEWLAVMDSDHQHEAISKVLQTRGVDVQGQGVGIHRRRHRARTA